MDHILLLIFLTFLHYNGVSADLDVSQKTKHVQNVIVN